MYVQNKTNISYKGYDAVPLKALYMQGLKHQQGLNIFREMQSIAQKEGLDLFLNQDNLAISKEFTKKSKYSDYLSIWGQDRKAFVENLKGKFILWNTFEPVINQDMLFGLKDFKINYKKHLPRGGDYYIGYKRDGEKWMIINDAALLDKNDVPEAADSLSISQLSDLFDIKEKNIHKIFLMKDDLDEYIRPIGFPYILVNDYSLALSNLKKLKSDFKKYKDVYYSIQFFLKKRIKDEYKLPHLLSCDEICEKLYKKGFIPIRIAGRYLDEINFMNAIAFQNKKDGISYITNSTRDSYEVMEILEKSFERELKEKVADITDVYFVSGGFCPQKEEKPKRFWDIFSRKSLMLKNNIMDILSRMGGGIHCMTAEVPDFEKIKAGQKLV